MSIYKVDTESIIALSRLLHVGANAVDQTMRQSAAPALRKIVFQRGADVFATAQRLADALRRMNTLKNDLKVNCKSNFRFARFTSGLQKALQD